MVTQNQVIVYAKQLQEMAGAHRNTISNWVKQERLPPPLRIGGRKAWPRDVIEKFLGMTPAPAPAK